MATTAASTSLDRRGKTVTTAVVFDVSAEHAVRRLAVGIRCVTSVDPEEGRAASMDRLEG